MNIDDELKLFKRMKSVIKEKGEAADIVNTLQLFRMLDIYISSSVDRNAVIRCLVEVGTNSFFSAVHTYRAETPVSYVPNRASASFIFADQIVRFYQWFSAVDNGESWEAEEVELMAYDAEKRFYFGEDLAKLNHALMKRLCPEAKLPSLE